jgi:phosphatidylglycerophosphate synthase
VWGKWTTTLQILTVLLVLVGKLWPLPPGLFTGCFYLTGVITAISGIHYICGGLAFLGQPPENRHG